MSDSPPAAELRRSVALLATEWWLLVGVLAGYLVFGAWVVGTGLAVAAAAPSLTATVGTTTVTAATVFAALAWLLLPAAVVTWLFERRLSNSYGNLRSHYRFDHPGVLPAPSGVAVLVFVVAAAAVGPHPAVVALGALGSAHLLVRTVAFGRRVYSFSPRRLFPLLTGLSAIALAAGWLVHAPGLPGPVGATVRRAGVESVVDTGTAVVGTTPATALGALVAVPALLSGLYLVVQTVAARRVRARAPLAAPDKRAEQRFPIMPPVPASERPGATVRPQRQSESSDAASDTQSADSSGEPSATDDAAETDDDSTHTRVFTADESVPDDAGVATQLASESDDDGDSYLDDTDVFSPDRGSGTSGECRACGNELPGDSSVTFCPNCGQKI